MPSPEVQGPSQGPFSLSVCLLPRGSLYLFLVLYQLLTVQYTYPHVHWLIVLKAVHWYRGLPPGPLYLVPRRVLNRSKLSPRLVMLLLSTLLPDPPPPPSELLLLPSEQPFQPPTPFQPSRRLHPKHCCCPSRHWPQRTRESTHRWPLSLWSL